MANITPSVTVKEIDIDERPSIRGRSDYHFIDDIGFFPFDNAAITNNRDPNAPEQSTEDMIREYVETELSMGLVQVQGAGPYTTGPGMNEPIPTESRLNRKQRRREASINRKNK